jgi:acyl-CoA synthetase (AMP-forming)/AMP-acid ligase II
VRWAPSDPVWQAALRDIDGVDHAFVTNLAGAQGDLVGAAVVCDTASTTVEQLRRSTRELLSSFKIPTVWLLLDSDDTIPRGPTGKVDVRRLREMLNAADSQASHRQEERKTGQPEHRNYAQQQHQDADPSGQGRTAP